MLRSVLLVLVLMTGHINCKRKVRSASSGSGILLARFDKVYNEFQQLKQHLGPMSQPEKDPAAHLKTSKCRFEDDCIFDILHDNTSSVFNWNRKSLRNEQTFPQHSTHSGVSNHFMVAKVEKSFKRNQHAIMTTEVPIRVSGQCVDFYYFLHSDDGCDSVRFSATLKCKGFIDETIVKTSGTKTKQWHYVLFDIQKPVGTQCQLQWRAAKGMSEEGKVGINDVSIHYENCPTNGRVFPARLSCSFDHDFCLWRELGQLKWKAKTQTVSLKHQHRIEQIYYIKINNSAIHVNPNKTGVILSPLTFHLRPKCLSFKWSLNGRDPGNLTISFLAKNETQDVWQDDYYEFQRRNLLMKDKEGPLWSKELIDLPVNEEYKIAIKFTSSSKEMFYSAFISDIVVLDGDCEAHQDPVSSAHNNVNLYKLALATAPSLINNYHKLSQCGDNNKCSAKHRSNKEIGTEDSQMMKMAGNYDETDADGQQMIISTCAESYVPIIFVSYLFAYFVRNTIYN